MTDAPIGIFDSGVGGLTVARAILDQLPHEQVLYTGDTAHLRSNVASLLKPPLPEADRQKLQKLFGHLTAGVGLDGHQR